MTIDVADLHALRFDFVLQFGHIVPKFVQIVCFDLQVFIYLVRFLFHDAVLLPNLCQFHLVLLILGLQLRLPFLFASI